MCGEQNSFVCKALACVDPFSESREFFRSRNFGARADRCSAPIGFSSVRTG